MTFKKAVVLPVLAFAMAGCSLGGYGSNKFVTKSGTTYVLRNETMGVELASFTFKANKKGTYILNGTGEVSFTYTIKGGTEVKTSEVSFMGIITYFSGAFVEEGGVRCFKSAGSIYRA